ncbi:MAG: outer membrane protein assembly factor BamD [Candidatus Binataceae bacterium]
MRRSLLIFLGIALLLVGGCALRKAPTHEDYYAQGQLDFAEGEYKASIENYQKLIDQFPFSPYAEDAEIKIGLAHFMMNEYAEAVASLDDFQRMHPTSKQLDLASYYIALSYYDQIGREDQDQTKTEYALKNFHIIEQRFPEGPFAQLAHEHAEVCREMLARHHMVIGNFYYKRANYRAVESRMAELMQKYADTPVAPEALYQLAVALEKEGKKYSAAQAFAAVDMRYPNTSYATDARDKVKQLNQPIDTEEDPLKLVLAQMGYNDSNEDARVIVRQRSGISAGTGVASPEAGAGYGADGLPVLTPATNDAAAAARSAEQGGPATLTSVRLSTTDPPLSVVLDLTGSVEFDKRIETAMGGSTVTISLKDVKPQVGLRNRIVFDRSIFRDCEITEGGNETTVTVNTSPILDYAVVPLTSPPRLLITFTPRESAALSAPAQSAF